MPKTAVPNKSKVAKSKPNVEAKQKKAEIDAKPLETKPKKLEVVSSLKATSSKEELDVAKDNLRLFVERWREHPNSPYSLDAETIVRGNPEMGSEDKQDLAGRMDNSYLELTSLRGQSPSPCGSVCSTSSEMSSGLNLEETNSMLAVPNSMVWGLERRASEGNSAGTGHRRDQAAQIVLAEEIIRLSEHLRSLATVRSGNEIPAVNPSPSQPNGLMLKESRSKPKEKTEKKAKSPKKLNGLDLEDSAKPATGTVSVPSVNNGQENNEISEKLSNITRQRKMNGTTFNGSRSYDKTNNSVTSFSLKKTFTKSRKCEENSTSGTSSSYGNISRDKTMDGVKDSKGTHPRVTWKIDNEQDQANSDRLSCRQTSNDENNPNNREMDLIPPWRRPRTMRRFGETCRDVPRISNLRDIHKNLNLDEPTSTKDLLLHLLGEWDDATRPGGIGRKSISVDWCGEESVARRSMNSLAEYFQSEQQKTTSSPVTNNPASTSSIHR